MHQVQATFTRCAASCALLAALTAFAQRAGAQDITALPYYITQPGTYALAADLHMVGSAAISITASDVILDLGGYTLSGTGGYKGSYSYGVWVSPGYSNVTIRNGTIAEFEIDAGIMLHGATGCTVSNVTVAGCGGGISMIDGGGHTIQNNTLDHNVHANMSVSNSSGNVIEGNTCTGAAWGVRLGGTSTGTVILGNSSDGGDIDITDTDGNTIIGNTVTNGWIGIYGEGADSTLAQGNTTIGNAQGIRLAGVGNTIVQNIANDNDEVGIWVVGSALTVEGNIANTNGTGLHMPNVSNSTIEENIANGNVHYGIVVFASAGLCGGNTVRGNVTEANGNTGLYVAACNDNTVREHKALNNGIYGIVVQDSSGNRVHKSMALDNILLDLVDNTCVNNQWKRNTFVTSEGACIE